MSSTLINFDYAGQQVRTIDINGEPWFVASDVAKILAYRMASDMTRRLDDHDKGSAKVRTPGGDQTMTVINESGLYDAVFRSNAEGAKQFRRWVTAEVLPQIRKTGAYGKPAPALTGPELMAKALIEANETMQAQARELEEARPKVEVADRFLNAEQDYSVKDAANALTRAGVKVGPQRLFTALEGYGWIYRGRGDGKWRPYRTYIERGLVSVLPQSHYHPKTGVLVLDAPQVRIAPNGMKQLMAMHGADTGHLPAA